VAVLATEAAGVAAEKIVLLEQSSISDSSSSSSSSIKSSSILQYLSFVKEISLQWTPNFLVKYCQFVQISN
jgi:hypothetical protein